MYVCICVCVCVCVRMCTYGSVYVCVYIHIHTYIYIHTYILSAAEDSGSVTGGPYKPRDLTGSGRDSQLRSFACLGFRD